MADLGADGFLSSSCQTSQYIISHNISTIDNNGWKIMGGSTIDNNGWIMAGGGEDALVFHVNAGLGLLPLVLELSNLRVLVLNVGLLRNKQALEILS